MKRIWKVALSLMIILLVGGGVAYTMGINKDYFRYLELKDYTEDYISPSQKSKGFVTYNSINNKFSFDFPENFFILQKFHSSTEIYENFYATYLNPKNKETFSSSIDIKVVHKQLEKDAVNIALEDTLFSHSFDNQYEQINLEDRTIYKGANHLRIDGKEVNHLDSSKNGTNYFFALVVDNKTFEAVEIVYSLICLEEEESKCDFNEEKERKTFEKMIDSISFE